MDMFKKARAKATAAVKDAQGVVQQQMQQQKQKQQYPQQPNQQPNQQGPYQNQNQNQNQHQNQQYQQYQYPPAPGPSQYQAQQHPHPLPPPTQYQQYAPPPPGHHSQVSSPSQSYPVQPQQQQQQQHGYFQNQYQQYAPPPSHSPQQPPGFNPSPQPQHSPYVQPSQVPQHQTGQIPSPYSQYSPPPQQFQPPQQLPTAVNQQPQMNHYQQPVPAAIPLSTPTYPTPPPQPQYQNPPPVSTSNEIPSSFHQETSAAPLIQSYPSQYQTQVAIPGQHPGLTKCSGFDWVLTDHVPYFILTKELLNSQNPPINELAVVICSYCYHTLVAPYPNLARCFVTRPKADRPTDKSIPQISFEKMGGCGFAFLRIRHTFVNLCVPRNSIQPIIEYAGLDTALLSCNKETMTGEYYGTNDIPGFGLCRTCYQSFIVGSSFERRFSIVRANGQWTCDVGTSGYILRTLVACIPSGDFKKFSEEAKKRLGVPECPGPDGAMESHAFRSVKDNSGLFCLECFYDKVLGTPAEKSFGYGPIELEDSQKGVTKCDLRDPYSKDAMDIAITAIDYDIWLTVVIASGKLTCPSIAGTDEADLFTDDPPTWYYFIDAPNVEVCPRCYQIDVTLARATHLLSPITRSPTPGVIRQCWMSPLTKDPAVVDSFDPMDYQNTTQWRGAYLRMVLNYGRDSGLDFTIAQSVLKMMSTLPPPCGSELRRFKAPSKRKWFGHEATNPNDPNDCTLIMCEECYDFAVKGCGTQLESFLSNDLAHLTLSNPDGHRCSTWSKQCKRRLKAACQSGTMADFAGYAQYHHKREDLYNRVWNAINVLKPMHELVKDHAAGIRRQTELNIQMGGLRLAQQMNAQTNAVIAGIGGSMAEASATDYGQRFGNSSVGTGYLTASGAHAAQAYQNAANMSGPGYIAPWQGGSSDQLMAEYKRILDIQKRLNAEWAIID